jgi:NAD(P)-dependent dehydrogenase (short-subunit alcohol dehydrogenase family)
VATARRPEQIADLAEGAGDTILLLPLDVTDQSQIKAAVAKAEQAFGAIDVLVNNAGYGYNAAVEEGEDKEIRAMFETNVFGLMALTRAVLPGMRARKRGHVVNFSSVAGLTCFPGSGYYCSTKHAVEGLSKALAEEVEPLGIHVTLVEPGPFRTDFVNRSLRQAEQRISDYAATSGARTRELIALGGKQPGDPVRAAKAILKAVDADKPPLHLVLGKPGLDYVRKEIARLQADLKAWEQDSLGADYPQAEALAAKAPAAKDRPSRLPAEQSGRRPDKRPAR